jgi:hypothetical protein
LTRARWGHLGAQLATEYPEAVRFAFQASLPSFTFGTDAAGSAAQQTVGALAAQVAAIAMRARTLSRGVLMYAAGTCARGAPQLASRAHEELTLALAQLCNPDHALAAFYTSLVRH